MKGNTLFKPSIIKTQFNFVAFSISTVSCMGGISRGGLKRETLPLPMLKLLSSVISKISHIQMILFSVNSGKSLGAFSHAPSRIQTRP